MIDDTIPLFSPSQELAFCDETLMHACQRVFSSGLYVNGAEGRKFEAALAQQCHVPFAVGVSSGTTALELLLRAENIGTDAKVIITAHTFVAVLEAILSVGAEPEFVDIDSETWQMPTGYWPDNIVIVCHLYGAISPAVESTANLLYEDASQSFGGLYQNRFVGTIARAGAVSFYPTKNLSAVGDAGVILTHDTELAHRLRALRNHGQTAPQVHEYCGTTGRMDELQAVILLEKLKHFHKFLEARRQMARVYLDHLCDLPLSFPKAVAESTPAPNLFVVRTPARDVLQNFLWARGISTGVHYPTPLHHMPAYRDYPWARISLPNSEKLCSEILSLPMWVGMSLKTQMHIVNAIRTFFEIR